MPNISLPTGKVIYVSTYDYFFQLDEKDVDEFYQSCIADDLGSFVDDPFSQRLHPGKLEVEDLPEIEKLIEDIDSELLSD